MSPENRSKIEGFGRDLTPELLGGTNAMFAQLNRGLSANTIVTRDISYGEHERNRLDIFTREGLSNAPVLVFLHGGGFVMGDKHTDGSPFYSNMGDFAARNGMVGVPITYRLAPESQFPSGADDLASAIDWLRENVAQYGGDPEKIVISGQSAGASHVAGYLAHRREHSAGIAGAALFSGIFDTTTCVPNQFAEAYYGKDHKAWAPASCMAGLLASEVPMQFSVAEFDPDDFHNQAAQLVTQWHATKGRLPEMQYLTGHNHLSPILSVGSDQKEVERMLAGFVGRVTR